MASALCDSPAGQVHPSPRRLTAGATMSTVILDVLVICFLRVCVCVPLITVCITSVHTPQVSAINTTVFCFCSTERDLQRICEDIQSVIKTFIHPTNHHRKFTAAVLLILLTAT